MTHLVFTQQALESGKHEPLQSLDDIRVNQISFYNHEVYALEKLIAKIIYDSDEFVTQYWLVIINGLEIHRANTWALVLQLHYMALQARNLAHATARSRNRCPRKCARQNTYIYC